MGIFMTDEYLVLREIKKYAKVSITEIAILLDWRTPKGKVHAVRVHRAVMRLAFFGYLATGQPGKYKRWKVTERGKKAVESDLT
jgi:hypothetical protein